MQGMKVLNVRCRTLETKQGPSVSMSLFMWRESRTAHLLPNVTRSPAEQPVEHVLTLFIREVCRD